MLFNLSSAGLLISLFSWRQINSLTPWRFEWNFRQVNWQVNFSNWWLRYHWGTESKVFVIGHHWSVVNIGSDNGLVLSVNVDLCLCHLMASLGHNELTHCGWNKMADILQPIISISFPYMIMFEFQIIFIKRCSWMPIFCSKSTSQICHMVWGNCCWSNHLRISLHTWLVNSSPLDKMAAISQMIFSDAFSWMKSFVFW